MFVRVLCNRCRLAPAWTDDADGLLATVCDRPLRCEGKVADDHGTDLTAAHMAARAHPMLSAPPTSGVRGAAVATRCHREPFSIPLAALVTVGAASLAAWTLSAALLSGYQTASVVPTLVVLLLPALVAYRLGGASVDGVLAPVVALSIAALGIEIVGAERISASPLDGLIVDAVSAAVSLLVPLPWSALFAQGASLLDGFDGWRTASVSFAAAATLLVCVGFPAAQRLARKEDAGLIRRLVPRTRAEGNELVIDGLSPQLATRAQQRVAVIADGELYDLADAKLGAMGEDDRVTLLIPLRTPSAPARIEFDGLRGPTTTVRQTVQLAAR